MKNPGVKILKGVNIFSFWGEKSGGELKWGVNNPYCGLPECGPTEFSAPEPFYIPFDIKHPSSLTRRFVCTGA